MHIGHVFSAHLRDEGYILDRHERLAHATNDPGTHS